MGRILRDVVTENAELIQQLTRKEAELTRAGETIRREQQQNQEMRQQVRLMCVVFILYAHMWGYALLTAAD